MESVDTHGTWQKTGRILLPMRGYVFPLIFLVFFFWRGWGYMGEDAILLWPAGFLILAFGIMLRLWGIRNIGGKAHTRHGKRLQKLITAGPFSITRNPLYAANIIIISAYAVIACVPWMAPATALVTFLMYHLIVHREEYLLVQSFGDEYVSYKHEVPRWGLTFDNFRPTPGDCYSWRRVFEVELGGFAATIIAVGALVAKNQFELAFNVWWALGLGAATILYVFVHIFKMRMKSKSRESKQEPPEVEKAVHNPINK
jgi:protein-S-isoprenylcysteine O-methyltransferase Ste14